MSLFFDDREWIKLEDNDARAILLRLNAQIVPPEEGGVRGPFIYPPESHAFDNGVSALPVKEVSRRRLHFYPPGYFAYRLACAIDAIRELSGYGTAFAFAVCGPAEAGGMCALIDWKSAWLHDLNSKLKLDLSRLDSHRVREYLVFFCTFIGGQEDSSGVVAPFFLPQDASVFAWDETLEDFQTLSRRRRLEMFPPLVEPDRGDEFDLPEPAEMQGDSSPDNTPSASAPQAAELPARRAVADSFAAHPGTPKYLPGSSESQGDAIVLPSEEPAPGAGREAAAPGPALGAEWTAIYEGLVWYGAALFLAMFRLERNGRIKMLGDQPIAGATALATPRWEVRRGPADVWLLCRQLKRAALSAAELLQRIDTDIKQRSAISGQAAPQRVRLRGLRVEDRLEWAVVFEGPVRLSDIEFTHDVVLDDSIFERSLELLNCRFLQRLSVRDVTVKGALRLDGSQVDGAVEIGASEGRKRQPPVLDLRGLVVDRGLFADRLTTFGRVRGEWIRVGGTVRARGLQIHPRNKILDGASALDLSHARINGPLDLAGWVAKEREPGGRQRTLFGGDAKLVGLVCEQAALDGVDIRGLLDLSSCRVKERLRMGVARVGREGDTWWRARVGGSFSLDRSQVGRVEMSGCRTNGDFHAADLQLSGALFADLAEGFRTRIGGDFTGSGANIKGGLELDGARIEGRILFVTGHLGRLYANVGAFPVIDPSSGRRAARLCASEAQGIVLQDVSVDASIQLIGIQLRHGSGGYGDGSLVAHSVRLGGGLRFWRGKISAELLRQALLRVATSEGHTDKDRTDAAERCDKLIDELRASIPGTLDLAGIRTGGALDLSRLSVGSEVNLSGAQIGGDADMRGLLITSNDFSARDANVTGQLLFATASSGTLETTSGSADVSHALVREGRLDLEGAKAARVVVSSANVALRSPKVGRKAAITLSRGQFGQLTVMGFEHESSRRAPLRFPCSIDLTAISVGDWEIDPGTESLPLLEATAPSWFDGRNFVDIEQRLAKIGRKDKADQVYRCMLKFGARIRGARFANWMNGAFSGNGTRPWLMLLWLVIALLPVIYMLKNPINVEFPGGTTVDGKDVRPISEGRRYDLDRDWDLVKAAGLASTYAIPFLGAGPDAVRARLIGDTCIDYLWSVPSRVAVTTSNVAARCDRGFTLPVSPHSVAMMFSTLQFFLWILVAANLPVIARRRP